MDKEGTKKKLTRTEIYNLKKDELREIVLAIQDKDTSENDTNSENDQGHTEGEDTDDVMSILKEILTEVKKYNEEKNAIKQSINELKEENKKLTDALMAQQRFLEILDTERRANKLIAFGVPETDFTAEGVTAASDDAKVKMVLQKIGHDVEITKTRRIGQQNDDKIRPIEVVLQDVTKRQGILNDAKKLKDMAAFKDINIRKDSHPAVRKEWRRLKEAEEAEKARNENVGKNVRIDYRTRVLYVDDVIVDRFNAKLFL